MSFLGIELWIRSLLEGVFFYSMLAVLGIASYVILAGFLMYAVGVFLLFIAEPGIMSVAAIHHPSIGLALLCLLVGLAGICGRAFRNLMSLFQGYLARFK